MSAAPELMKVAELAARELGLSGVDFCGKGAFKETYRVRDTANKILALKLVDRTKIQVERTEREIAAVKRCNSRRIAQVLETRVFTAPDRRVFDVVLEEFFDGGTLEDRLKAGRFSKEQTIDLGIGLLLAVRDLHPLQLVHRDIKPANVMFRNGSADPVLVDFGLVRDLSQSSLTATWLPRGPGTPFYSSPEQLNNDKGMIDWRSDQFSIGVTICHMLTGRHPYQTDVSNPSSAVYAVVERRGPTDECRQELCGLGVPAVVRMVGPWPVERFTDPDQAIAALKA
jgi:serine/threonine protein kinase